MKKENVIVRVYGGNIPSTIQEALERAVVEDPIVVATSDYAANTVAGGEVCKDHDLRMHPAWALLEVDLAIAVAKFTFDFSINGSAIVVSSRNLVKGTEVYINQLDLIFKLPT